MAKYVKREDVINCVLHYEENCLAGEHLTTGCSDQPEDLVDTVMHLDAIEEEDQDNHFDKIVTDQPRESYEKILNLAYATKEGAIKLRSACGKKDIRATEFAADLGRKMGWKVQESDFYNGNLVDSDPDEVFTLVYCLSVQAAELRERVRYYENSRSGTKENKMPRKRKTLDIADPDDCLKTTADDLFARLGYFPTDVIFHKGIVVYQYTYQDTQIVIAYDKTSKEDSSIYKKEGDQLVAFTVKELVAVNKLLIESHLTEENEENEN